MIQMKNAVVAVLCSRRIDAQASTWSATGTPRASSRPRSGAVAA